MIASTLRPALSWFSLVLISSIAALVVGGAGTAFGCDQMKAEQETVCNGGACAGDGAVTEHHQPECSGDDCVSKDKEPNALPPVASRD